MIRVVSWNVLADAYVRREYYPHTPPEVLDRAARRREVARRAVERADDADLLCLQEIDGALFAILEEELVDLSGRLCKKRGRGEGCAIFVRKSLAPEIAWRELALSDRSGHVALGASFGGLDVVCTHLKWEPPDTPEGAHRGRAQLSEILQAWPPTRSSGSIVCGDFNADPESAVLASSRASGLFDAYASLPHAFTCNANDRKKRIDFILHSSHFVATPVPLPPIEDDTPLPSHDHPSDHLAIGASLERR